MSYIYMYCLLQRLINTQIENIFIFDFYATFLGVIKLLTKITALLL